MAIENDVYMVKLLRELRRAGGSTVLRYRDESLFGEALLALIFQYARVLRGLGIRRGTLLGMFAPNRPEAIAIRYAAHLLGGRHGLSLGTADGKSAAGLAPTDRTGSACRIHREHRISRPSHRYAVRHNWHRQSRIRRPIGCPGRDSVDGSD